jgi:hypothetical protein
MGAQAEEQAENWVETFWFFRPFSETSAHLSVVFRKRRAWTTEINVFSVSTSRLLQRYVYIEKNKGHLAR